MKFSITLFNLVAIFSFFSCYANNEPQNNEMQQLQNLHEKIGNTLINVSKKHSDTKTEVYKGLDLLEKIRNLWKNTIKENSKVKISFEQNKQKLVLLKQNLIKYENRCTILERKLEKTLSSQKKQQEQLFLIKQKNDKLKQKNNESNSKMSRLKNKFNALRSSLNNDQQNINHQSLIQTSTTSTNH